MQGASGPGRGSGYRARHGRAPRELSAGRPWTVPAASQNPCTVTPGGVRCAITCCPPRTHPGEEANGYAAGPISLLAPLVQESFGRHGAGCCAVVVNGLFSPDDLAVGRVAGPPAL